jgi:alanine dehydrogenase
MSGVETMVLTASDVARSLSPAECRAAVEEAFVRLAEGRVPPARAMGFEAPTGTFHAKVALYDAGRSRFVAKVNGNFPANPAATGLPTIQGVLLLYDAADGRPIAMMDSGMVTALRTAAASAVAADHLARRDASVLAVIGCGLQAGPHVTALREVRTLREVRLFDMVPGRAAALAARYGADVPCRVVESVAEATLGADLIVTCTSGRAFLLDVEHVAPGTFVAAVGVDNPYKRELHPRLMAAARVVVDDVGQCAASGDLHHAIRAGTMTRDDVHAELANVVVGRHAPIAAGAIVVFDSTGVALEDAAAADAVYERAKALGLGGTVRLAD